jgi:anti-sigma-K factor RskA
VNVKEYIESGVLEAYVLDALTPGERAQVAADIAQYPELADELAAIELAMQRFAEANAIEPPTHLQDKIWNALQEETVAETSESTYKEVKIVPLSTDERMRQAQWQRAAVWIVLVGSMLVNLFLWSQNNKSQQQQVALQQQQTSLQQRLDSMQQQQQAVVQANRKEKEMLADTAMQTIVMHTTQPAHPMVATIYWSRDKGEAYVSIGKLPMPPAGMQYQMWVIQDGKPVDMGVLPNSIVYNDGMQKLPGSVTSGQAFAISLEKEGGSPVPTMANIYVMGKVAS